MSGIMCAQSFFQSALVAAKWGNAIIPEKDRTREMTAGADEKTKGKMLVRRKKLRQEKIHKTVGKAQHKMGNCGSAGYLEP